MSSSALHDSLSLIAVGFLWGVSNPFMKRGSQGVTELPKSSWTIINLIREYIFLFTSPLYLISFLVNMCGSVLFYKALGDSDLSMIVVMSNSLTFLFTTITSKFLGEEGTDIYTYVGMASVLLGVAICISAKSV
eukprot:TRINITY_DN4631_c0_g1_i1.p1 TRINITY_DN4631_c0_g1~~TRINITY_DN4631_c0_g1_i1.p1  ORF type:complete len:144 (+),score=32.75 TRINITY_DN4631_c0_g1_i1:32-433(+)